MTRLDVVVSADAKRQIIAEVLYIAEDSVNRAFAWEDRLMAGLRRLGDFHGHAVDEDGSERAGRTVRKVVFERTYLVHYEVDATIGKVFVVNVRSGTRQPRHGEP